MSDWWAYEEDLAFLQVWFQAPRYTVALVVFLTIGFLLQGCTNDEEERAKALAEWIGIRTELKALLRQAGHKYIPVDSDFRVPIFPKLSTHDRAQYAAYLVHGKGKPCSSISYFFAKIEKFTLHCDGSRRKYLLEKKGIDWYVTEE